MGIISFYCGKLHFYFFCRVRFPNEPLLKAVWETAPTFLKGNSFPQQILITKKFSLLTTYIVRSNTFDILSLSLPVILIEVKNLYSVCQWCFVRLMRTLEEIIQSFLLHNDMLVGKEHSAFGFLAKARTCSSLSRGLQYWTPLEKETCRSPDQA